MSEPKFKSGDFVKITDEYLEEFKKYYLVTKNNFKIIRLAASISNRNLYQMENTENLAIYLNWETEIEFAEKKVRGHPLTKMFQPDEKFKFSS